MKKLCSDCGYANAVDAARCAIAVQLMDATQALDKMRRALALAGSAYEDLADASVSLGS